MSFQLLVHGSRSQLLSLYFTNDCVGGETFSACQAGTLPGTLQHGTCYNMDTVSNSLGSQAAVPPCQSDDD